MVPSESPGRFFASTFKELQRVSEEKCFLCLSPDLSSLRNESECVVKSPTIVKVSQDLGGLWQDIPPSAEESTGPYSQLTLPQSSYRDEDFTRVDRRRRSYNVLPDTLGVERGTPPTGVGTPRPDLTDPTLSLSPDGPFLSRILPGGSSTKVERVWKHATFLRERVLQRRRRLEVGLGRQAPLLPEALE